MKRCDVIQYVGPPGVTKTCSEAVVRLLQFGDQINRVRILSRHRVLSVLTTVAKAAGSKPACTSTAMVPILMTMGGASPVVDSCSERATHFDSLPADGSCRSAPLSFRIQ